MKRLEQRTTTYKPGAPERGGACSRSLPVIGRMSMALLPHVTSDFWHPEVGNTVLLLKPPSL